MLKRTLAMAGVAALMSATASAECAFENEVPIRSLTAGFEAWKSVTDAMAECGNFEAELDQEFRTKQSAAFAANPALYHIGGVSNGTITPLLNEGTIRPLNDLVEQYGQHLKPNQLIRVGDDIMAIAMMVNTQELMYRKDVFDEMGLEPPENYEELLEVASALQEAEGIEYPLGGTTMAGWDLALEFINMYAGLGGGFVDEAGNPTLNNEMGVQALETLKAASEYMDPEYLVSDSTYVQQQMQQGKIAMANLWASRGGAMDNEAESTVVGDVYTDHSPASAPGTAPAATLWWDGIVIAQNITDEEAEAAFRVALEGMDREMVEAHNDDAIWLIEGYEPGRLAQGAIATATYDPPPLSYPSTTEMGLVHTAIGNQISGFFTGERTAEEALSAAEDEYLTAAREAGLIK